MKKDNQKEQTKSVNEGRPGYKHTQLGWIPEEWELKVIGEIGLLSSGTTPSRQNHTKYFENGSIPWVKTTDLNNSEIFETEECVTNIALNETSLRVFPIDTILVAMYGGFNQIGRTGLLKLPATINQALTAVQLNNGDNPKYIHEWLNHRVGYWKNFAGSSRKDPNINGKDVRDFPVLLPTRNEQLKIAYILSTWDSAITKTQQLIEQLKLRNKGLMQELLTGKKRLAQFKDKWQKVRIGDILIESRTPSISNNPGKRITVRLKLKGVEKRVVRGTESEDATYYFVRRKGQFIYGKQNLHKGAFGLIPEELDQYESSQDIPSFDFEPGFDPYYFLFYLGQEQVYSSLEKYATGTGSKRIHPENLFKVQLRYPSLKEQNSIANILVNVSQELASHENMLYELQKQKSGLMQKLLSGEIRVKP